MILLKNQLTLISISETVFCGANLFCRVNQKTFATYEATMVLPMAQKYQLARSLRQNFRLFAVANATLWSVSLPTNAFAVSAGSEQRVVLTGSSTIAPLVSELAKDFEKSHKDTRIETQTGGSAKGIADCRAGRNDIAMVSRDLETNEKGLNSIEIAKDGLAFIVNKSNSVSSLSKEQVLRIYTGKMTNWKELGGQDKPIISVSKAEGRATLEVFMHYFGLKASEIKASVIIGDEQQGIKTVATTEGAIAFLGVSTAISAEQSGIPVHALSFEGKSPTVANVRSHEYPIVRRLHLVTCSQPKKSAQELIDFVKSSKGQALVEKLNFIPL